MFSPSVTARVAVAALACVSFAAVAAPRIVPPEPVALERLHLRLTIDDCVFDKDAVHVELHERTLRVHHRSRQCLVPGAPEVVDILLGALPAGDYAAELVDDASGVSSERIAFRVNAIAGTLQFPAIPVPLADHSGIWGSPAEPGWGLSLHQGAFSTLFGALLVFDRVSQPQWYTLQAGRWITTTRWTGSLVRSEGSPWSSAVYVPDATPYEVVGSATLDFRMVPGQEDKATLSYSIDGQSVTKSIARAPLR
jgi:hypothetical protein